MKSHSKVLERGIVIYPEREKLNVIIKRKDSPAKQYHPGFFSRCRLDKVLQGCIPNVTLSLPNPPSIYYQYDKLTNVLRYRPRGQQSLL